MTKTRSFGLGPGAPCIRTSYRVDTSPDRACAPHAPAGSPARSFASAPQRAFCSASGVPYGRPRVVYRANGMSVVDLGAPSEGTKGTGTWPLLAAAHRLSL